MIRKYAILAVSIFIATMFLMPLSSIAVYEDDTPETQPANRIWFVKGTFEFLDEDEYYIYLDVMEEAKLRGFGHGISYYLLDDTCSIKILKPFYGVLPSDSSSHFGIGICRAWDHVIE